MRSNKIKEAIGNREDVEQLITTSVLGAFSLCCRKNKDFAPEWEAYIATFPGFASVDCFPIAMSEADLKWLEGS